jgi:dipeptidyl aminopeptidase/acylaminoacyl peptidase
MRRNRSSFALFGFGVAFLSAGVVGCGGGASPSGPSPASYDTASFPERGQPQRLEGGIQVYEVFLGAIETGKVWLYLPPKFGKEKLPCVMIAPAGSNLVTGKELDDGDRPEHLPYLEAGFAVVAFALDGPMPEQPRNPDREAMQAITAFMSAEAGLVDARRALDFALAKMPEIDPTRIYTAGHSSAGTVALLVAEHDPRITGCIAYAPCTDVVKRIGSRHTREIARSIPGFEKFLTDSSPLNHVRSLQCPVFLFHAEDDRNVPIGESAHFVDELKRTNPNVTFVRVPRGGHSRALGTEGIPRAVRWLKKLAAEQAGGRAPGESNERRR